MINCYFLRNQQLRSRLNFILSLTWEKLHIFLSCNWWYLFHTDRLIEVFIYLLIINNCIVSQWHVQFSEVFTLKWLENVYWNSGCSWHSEYFEMFFVVSVGSHLFQAYCWAMYHTLKGLMYQIFWIFQVLLFILICKDLMVCFESLS